MVVEVWKGRKANVNCLINKVSFESKQSTRVIPREDNYLFLFFQRKTWTSFIDWNERWDLQDGKAVAKFWRNRIWSPGANPWLGEKKHFLGCIYTCADVDMNVDEIINFWWHLSSSCSGWKAHTHSLKVEGNMSFLKWQEKNNLPMVPIK